MLCAWGFERVGVVASDLYFVDPNPGPGEGGAEHGVRLEVRLLERPPRTGSVYAAQPIVIDRPVWRADLLETVEGPPGSGDRHHHHPVFRGWEPGRRDYDEAIRSNPVSWLEKQLTDLPSLLAGTDVPADAIGPDDAAQLAAAAPQIATTVAGLLAQVRAGELGRAPSGGSDAGGGAGVRASWL
ncbi:MAG: hypothetical protein JO337_06725 [Acidimicrobiales bacterium]|nr:hypothetical protein [Acidimicrobiales bacterium]